MEPPSVGLSTFRRTRLLGEGGAGKVWLVEDPDRASSPFALKALFEADAGRVERLRREFALLAQLAHPNLVRVMDFIPGALEEGPCYTMEFVEGSDLVTAVRREGPETFLLLATEALRALAFLHDFDVIHRDLKPANLLVRDRPVLGCRLVVLDFGLALRGGHDRAHAEVAGTPTYLAPEIFGGASPGPRADLYSLGALLYEAVHGRPPVVPNRGDLEQFVEAVRAGRRTRSALPEGYAAGVRDWLESLLAPDPADRPSTAAAALASLGKAVGRRIALETPVGRAARLASGPPPGREREIEELWDLLSVSEGPRIVWLTGPAGSGRGRMMRWLYTDAIAKGWDVATMSAARAPAAAGESWDVAAVLGELRERAGRRPTLLLLDHATSGGRRIYDLLRRLAHGGGSAPLRAVVRLSEGEERHPELRALVDQTGKVPAIRRLDLPLLDQDGVRALAVRSAGARGVSESRVRWLHATSQGNPLVAETLLTEEVWERGEGHLPPERSTALQLKRISEDGIAWLEALAVLGDEAAPADVSAVAGLETAMGVEAFAEVQAAGFVARGAGGWSFASRTQAAHVLRLIPPERRRELHRRGAERTGEDGSPSARRQRLLARLWSGAGDAARAARHALEAARLAEEDADPALAADAYRDALANTSRRDPCRFERRVMQAAALREATQFSAAVRAYRAAAYLAPTAELANDLRARQAEMMVQSGQFEAGSAVANDALQRAQELGQEDVAARALEALGVSCSRRGRPVEALEYLREAYERFGRLPDPRDRAHAAQVLGIAEANAGLAEAAAHFKEAVDLYGRLREPRRALLSELGLGVLDLRAARYAEAEQLFEAAGRRAAELGIARLEGFVHYYRAKIALHRDRLDASIFLSEKAEDPALHLGDERLACISRTLRASALARGGQVPEAVALVETTLERPMTTVDPYLVGELRIAWAEAQLASPSTDEIRLRTTMAETLALCREWGDPDGLLWCLVVEMERRSRLAFDEPLDPIRAEFDELVARGGAWAQPFHVVRADLAEAAWLVAAGRFEDGLRRAEIARERAKGPGYLAREAQAAALCATATESLGKPREAEEARELARELLDRAAADVGDLDLRRGLVERRDFGSIRRCATPPASADDKRLNALYEMIRAVNSERETDALLESILDRVIDVVGARRGVILLLDPGTGEFGVSLARNLEKETLEDVRSYSRRIVREAGAGRPVLVINPVEDGRFRDLPSITLFRIRSLMCVPLRSRGTIVGAVYVDDRGDGRLFTSEDLRFLEAFADHAGLALQNAHERERLVQENRRLQTVAEERVRFDNIVGRCAAMQRVFQRIEQMAATSLPVLIHGETGTGKELVARAIHFHSSRRKEPFISENCAALPESLLQSELFGHVRGAFTGAERERRGLFELADGGTLFLDEVGDMSPAMQAQLLRVLQEGEIRRVGGDRSIRVDVRPILATHRDLEGEVAAGRFREDLMYRLQVLVIHLPPLRERPGDLPLLVDVFLEQIAERGARAKPRIPGRLVARLEEYAWPGNVRELQNAIYRAVVLAGEGPITEEVFAADAGLARILATRPAEAGLPVAVGRSETERIREALRRTSNNRSKAARLLGISRATLYRKIAEYDL